MKTLQRSLDDTTRQISIKASIVATPGLIKINLAIVLRLEHHDNLGSGIHHFELSKHTYASQNLSKSWANQNQVIAVGVNVPSLADADTLTAAYDVSLPASLAIA